MVAYGCHPACPEQSEGTSMPACWLCHPERSAAAGRTQSKDLGDRRLCLSAAQVLPCSDRIPSPGASLAPAPRRKQQRLGAG